MALNEKIGSYEHPAYELALKTPGLSVAVARIDDILQWGIRNSLWMFPMATSCCGIELMAAAAARVDLDRMGSILRATPRQTDVMVVAGTITVKMAPRVKKLWDQMPEPKWCIAMGSCAISGDFYRNIYSVVPGIDTLIPVDVYIPGCPPNPEALMQGLMRLQEKVKADRKLTKKRPVEPRTEKGIAPPAVKRITDPDRDPAITAQQEACAAKPGDSAGQAPEAMPLSELEIVPDGAAPDVAQDYAAILASVAGISALPKDAPPLVPVDRHLELARALRAAGYTSFTYVVASHWPAPAPKTPDVPKGSDEFEVACGVRRPGRGAELAAWRVRVPAGTAVPTLAHVYAGADWQEREQLDLVGVTFEGHPDPRRLMLPQAWEGHPLRRDYPIDRAAAPWR